MSPKHFESRLLFATAIDQQGTVRRHSRKHRTVTWDRLDLACASPTLVLEMLLNALRASLIESYTARSIRPAGRKEIMEPVLACSPEASRFGLKFRIQLAMLHS